MKIPPTLALTLVSLLTPILTSAQDRTLGKVSIEPVEPGPPRAEVTPLAPRAGVERLEPRAEVSPAPKPKPVGPITVTVDNFNDVVIDNDRFVLVDFWAPWCGPCRSMEPTIEKIARDFLGKVDVVKINVDEESPLADHMEVRGLPTLFLFKNGRPVDEMVGFVDERTLVRSIERELDRAAREPAPRRADERDDHDHDDRRPRETDPDPRAITRGSRSFP